MTTDRKTAPDAVDLLLLGLIAAAWAARALVAGLIALALTLAGWRPSTPRACNVAPAPAPHPLAQLATVAADQLQGLTVPQLRRLAARQGLPRALSHKGRRGQLLEALGGLEVAMA